MLVFGAAEVRFSRSPKLPTLDTALTWATAAAFMQLPRFDFRRVEETRSPGSSSLRMAWQGDDCLPKSPLVASEAAADRARHRAAG